MFQAAERLRATDAELVDRLIAIGGPPPLRRREPGFAGLAAIIVSQQVSVASATAIFGRLQARVAPLEAAEIARTNEDDLRACGLSSAKIRARRGFSRSTTRRRASVLIVAIGCLKRRDARSSRPKMAVALATETCWETTIAASPANPGSRRSQGRRPAEGDQLSTSSGSFARKAISRLEQVRPRR